MSSRLRVLSVATAFLGACAAFPTFFESQNATLDSGLDGASVDAPLDAPLDAAICTTAVRAQGTASCGTAPSGSLAIARGPLSVPLMAASKTDLFYIVSGTLVQRPLSAWGLTGSATALDAAPAPPIELSLDACPLSVLYTFTPDELARVKKLLPFGDSGVCIAMDAGATDAGSATIADAADADPGTSYAPHALSVLCSVDGHGPYLPLVDAIARQSDAFVKSAGPARLVDSYDGVLYWISEIPPNGKRPTADAIFSWQPTTVPQLTRIVGDDKSTACHNYQDCSYKQVTTQIGACQNFPNRSTHFSAGGGVFETLSAAAQLITGFSRNECQVPTWTSAVGAAAGVKNGFSTAMREDGFLGFDTQSGTTSLRITTAGEAIFRAAIVPPGSPLDPGCSVPQCYAGVLLPGEVPLVAVPVGGRKVVTAASSGVPTSRLLALVTEGAFAGDYDIRIGSGFDSKSAQSWAPRFGAVRSKIQGSHAMAVVGVGNEFLIAVTAGDGAACSPNDGFIARFAP